MNIHRIAPAVFCLALSLSAESPLIRQADSLIALKGLENFSAAFEMLEQACARSPDDYETHWKASIACNAYATALKYAGGDDWKTRNTVLAKKGMTLAEKAIAIDSGRVEGYFFYAANVGTYSDAVSVVRALKEGLKGKVQRNLEKAYEIDKSFMDGGPAVALGRFWAVVPWPFQDRKKALTLYREYQKLNKNNTLWEQRTMFLCECLIEEGKQHYPEAEILLKKITASKNRTYAGRANELLIQIGKK